MIEILFALTLTAFEPYALALPSCSHIRPHYDSSTKEWSFYEASPEGNPLVCLQATTDSLCKFQDSEQNCQALYDYTDGLRAPSPYKGVYEFDAVLQTYENQPQSKRLHVYGSDTPCGNQAIISFYGFTNEGAALIETNTGIQAVHSPNLSIGTEARILIDAESGEVVRRLMAPHGVSATFGYRFVSDSEVYLSTEQNCYTAIDMTRGQFSPANGKCGRVGKKETPKSRYSSYSDEGVSEAKHGDLEIAIQAEPSLKEVLSTPNSDSHLRRIDGTSIIVVNRWIACT